MIAKTWFIIMVNVDPSWFNEDIPYGYWQPWSKKYKTLRRAQQALSYYEKDIGTWGIRIFPCIPPMSQQERTAKGIHQL